MQVLLKTDFKEIISKVWEITPDGAKMHLTELKHTREHHLHKLILFRLLLCVMS